MDSSLDDIIASRPRGGGGGGPRRNDRRPPPARAPPPRREDFPRDGVRKYRRDERTNIDSDWVHDRYEDDRYETRRRLPIESDRYEPTRAAPPTGSRVRIDNLHYELTEDDLRELFSRIGRVLSVRILYDRSDRSQGTAYVVYEDKRDAHRAVADFDGCNANGQPIHLTMMPSAPAAASKGTLFDRIERPPRSLFERIEGGAPERLDSDEGRRPRRERSDSPRKARGTLHPDMDRYAPVRGSRSPIRRRGTPRDPGRRPGQKREDGAKGPRRARTDDDGRPMVGGRPKKTAEELDAEMDDYFGSKAEGTTGTDAANADASANGTNGAAAPAAGDIDMDLIE